MKKKNISKTQMIVLTIIPHSAFFTPLPLPIIAAIIRPTSQKRKPNQKQKVPLSPFSVPAVEL